MKLLLLSYSDSGGGAAIASLRLCIALRSIGQEAVLGVVEKKTAYDFVRRLPAPPGFLRRVRRKFLSRLSSCLLGAMRTSNSILHSLNMYSKVDVNWINDSNFDIVHLHWINHDMISLKDISRIKKPLLWTMHDTWAFCGAEHYPNILENDIRYSQGYYRKTKPKTTGIMDLSRYVFSRKLKYLAKKKIDFISPSRWEESLFMRSELYRRSSRWTIRSIVNVLDRNDYKRLKSEDAKELLGLSRYSEVIGFGAAYGISDKPTVKGGHLLLSAMKKYLALKESGNTVLMVFGPADEGFAKEMNIPVIALGQLDNERLMNIAYNCCDVFVCPSVVENLPNTCLEAASCGIPVAAFRTGGIPETVEHLVTGYLAEPFDTEELAQGIRWCIKNKEMLAAKAVEKISKEYDSDGTAKKHVDLYTKVLTEFS